jgi:protein ImuB
MRRVVSVWLPTWPTDRLNKQAAADFDVLPAEAPLVTVTHDGRRQAVAAIDEQAHALGVRLGMALAQAQALVPGLTIRPAQPEADEAGLRRLAAWCLRYAPLVAPDPPDGLWIDITGCELAHLHLSRLRERSVREANRVRASPAQRPSLAVLRTATSPAERERWTGEAALLIDLTTRLEAAGIAVRAAVADTPGAAHALARHAAEPLAIAPPNGTAAALAILPVAALRLDAETADSLHHLGLSRIDQLAAIPRGPLARRFGPQVLRRLDQALGRMAEPIAPITPPSVIASRLGFIDPLLTAESFAAVIEQLTTRVCGKLSRAGIGARRLDLWFERADGSVQTIRIGTSRPSRDAAHLARLLTERLETIDPGLGVEAMRLAVSLADRLSGEQSTAALADGDTQPDISALVDRLANRLGVARIWRAAPVESDVPERSVRRVPPMAPQADKGWPDELPRPARLLSPPQSVEAIALLPDHPPAAFTWRRRRFRVRRADGPERIHGEWWRHTAEAGATRDYWRVEDEGGRRFWLYRSGDGNDSATGNLRWFLHGIF